MCLVEPLKKGRKLEWRGVENKKRGGGQERKEASRGKYSDVMRVNLKTIVEPVERGRM